MKFSENRSNKNNIINQIAFGKKIRKYREQAGISRSDLAEKIGVSVNFLGDIERGLKLPSVPTLIVISNTLKVSLDSLLSDSLNNIVAESNEEIYYTEKQKIVINKLINSIIDNFK